MSLFLKAPVHLTVHGSTPIPLPLQNLSSLCQSILCYQVSACPPNLVAIPLLEASVFCKLLPQQSSSVYASLWNGYLGIDQRLQPSWERPHKTVCDRWQIAIAELVLSPGPALGTEWMSVVCPTCTTGIVTHKHMNSWAVPRWLSPCVALPPHQQPAHAWVSRVAGSTQTRPLTVKVEMWGGSLFWEGLQALHTTRATTTKQWSWCSPTI